MIKRIIGVCLLSACFSSSVIAAVFTLGAGHQLSGAQYSYGPNVAGAVANNSNVKTAIELGRDAWDVTNAVDHIGALTGSTGSSDCPNGQTWIIGAFAFTGNTCATNSGQGILNSYLGYADAYNPSCAYCNTKSITVNLDYAWVVNGAPMSGQYDVRSHVAHEMGHILGFAHQRLGVCEKGVEVSCSTNSAIETMHAFQYDGQTCHIDVETNDAQTANSYYP